MRSTLSSSKSTTLGSVKHALKGQIFEHINAGLILQSLEIMKLLNLLIGNKSTKGSEKESENIKIHYEGTEYY